MICTSESQGAVLYDRKSNRHNWRIICSSPLEHLYRVAEVYRHKVTTWGKWPDYQQAIKRFDPFPTGDHGGHVVPDSLPRNATMTEVLT